MTGGWGGVRLTTGGGVGAGCAMHIGVETSFLYSSRWSRILLLYILCTVLALLSETL